MDMNYVTQEELQQALEYLPERAMVEIHNSVLRVRLEAALQENAALRHQVEILEQAVRTPAPASRDGVLVEPHIVGNGGLG